MAEPVRREQGRRVDVASSTGEAHIHIGRDGSSTVTDPGGYFAHNPLVKDHLDFLERLRGSLYEAPARRRFRR